MKFFKALHHAFVPGGHNAYRPHLLRRDALIFFLVAVLAIEGLFFAGLFVRESPFMLAAAAGVPAQTPAAPFMQSLERQVVKVVADPRAPTAWALGSVLAVLGAALVFTFFFHLHIQPMDLLAPGALVAGIAVMFLFLNAHFFLNLPFSQTRPSAMSLYIGGLSSVSETPQL